jgi:2-iminobutanoate/2-iminopropanoate deaminase
MRLASGSVAAVLGVMAVAGCTLEPRTDRDGPQADQTPPRKQVVEVPGVARLPAFSSGIRSGDFVFLSGAIGALPGVSPPTLVEGGIGPETRVAMENLRTILEAAGGTMADIVKCTVFLADMSDYAGMNEVYLEFFPSDPPARSALAANGLAFDARVEIECIAAAPEGS